MFWPIKDMMSLQTKLKSSINNINTAIKQSVREKKGKPHKRGIPKPNVLNEKKPSLHLGICRYTYSYSV